MGLVEAQVGRLCGEVARGSRGVDEGEGNADGEGSGAGREGQDDARLETRSGAAFAVAGLVPDGGCCDGLVHGAGEVEMDAACAAGEAAREMDHAAEGACRGVDRDVARLDGGVFHMGGCVEEQGEGLTVQRGDPGEAGALCDRVLHAHSRVGEVDGVVAG